MLWGYFPRKRAAMSVATGMSTVEFRAKSAFTTDLKNAISNSSHTYYVHTYDWVNKKTLRTSPPRPTFTSSTFPNGYFQQSAFSSITNTQFPTLRLDGSYSHLCLLFNTGKYSLKHLPKLFAMTSAYRHRRRNMLWSDTSDKGGSNYRS